MALSQINSYRITDVAVVDPLTGAVTTHQDIHVDNGMISRIGATAGHASDPAAVDGSSRFAVPGYVDMHAHPLGLDDPHDALSLMLTFGITGYRQMAGSPELLRRRRDGSLDFGEHTSRLLALPGALLTPLNAGRPNVAVTEVRRQAADGADFVKAAMITPEVYFAVQTEADRHGIPVAGHLPAGIDVRAASRAGFRSIEHVGPGIGVIASCSGHEDDIPQATGPRLPSVKLPFLDKIVEKMIKRLVVNPAQVTKPAELETMHQALETFDEQKARELARLFVANDTWNCPTLIRVKGQELCDDPALAADDDLRYVSPEVRKAWNRAAEAFAGKFTTTQRAVFAAQFAMQQRLVKILDEEGAGLLAGTDAVGAAWVVAGASLHDEFDLLAEAGLTPTRILRMATYDAAQFLGRTDVAGTLDRGKEADLILLDADPTASVDNLHKISTVVRGGTQHGASELAAMRDKIAARGIG
jgi:imidazolonepropionase-like amidohydrolase